MIPEWLLAMAYFAGVCLVVIAAVSIVFKGTGRD